MKYSKTTLDYAKHLLRCYVKHDEVENAYVLEMDDLTRYDIERLCSYMMADCKDKAIEATGPDNEDYLKILLPTLQKFLNDSTNLDNVTDFVTSWRKGIINYYYPAIENLFAELVEEYNNELQ